MGTNGHLTGHVAIVTGASSGIGRAIALALAREGAELYLPGRNPSTLSETVKAAQQFSKVVSFQVDLTNQEDLLPLVRHLELEVGKLNILIHCAGMIRQDLMQHARVEDLDLQYI